MSIPGKEIDSVENRPRNGLLSECNAGPVVATVRKTSAVPLPAATFAVLSEQVLTAGQPVNVRATGFGNVPLDGVIVTSYFADDPIAIVAGPELLIVKLNAFTLKEIVVFAVRAPDVPMTVTV
jgi:hypothetical protein